MHFDWFDYAHYKYAQCKQKGFTLIVVILAILVAGAVAGGFLVYTNYLNNQTIVEQLSNEEKKKLLPPSESTSSADETANWKTYTNTKYGYSIKYPSDQFTNCSNNKDGLYLFSGGEDTRGCGLGEERTEFLIINTKQGTGNFEKSDFEQCYSVQKESIIVDGVTGIKYSNIFKNDQGECAIQTVLYVKNSVHIILDRNGKLYNIAFFEDSDKDIKYKIISTFKFQ